MSIATVILLFIAMSAAAAAQGTGTIRGKVADEDNLLLSGANVVIKELRLGTATDQNGETTLLRVPAGTHTLTVSCIGYQSTA